MFTPVILRTRMALLLVLYRGGSHLPSSHDLGPLQTGEPRLSLQGNKIQQERVANYI